MVKKLILAVLFFAILVSNVFARSPYDSGQKILTHSMIVLKCKDGVLKDLGCLREYLLKSEHIGTDEKNLTREWSPSSGIAFYLPEQNAVVVHFEFDDETVETLNYEVPLWLVTAFPGLGTYYAPFTYGLEFELLMEKDKKVEVTKILHNLPSEAKAVRDTEFLDFLTNNESSKEDGMFFLSFRI